jgi:hypothetical protein
LKKKDVLVSLMIKSSLSNEDEPDPKTNTSPHVSHPSHQPNSPLDEVSVERMDLHGAKLHKGTVQCSDA